MPEALKIRRALLSVYDKTGIVEFAKALHEEFGIELISTGGTAKTLADASLPVTLVEEITGFPEMLDGRVKTLHPRIYAAILADRDNPEHMRQLKEQGIEPIDMVVANLYPFEQTIRRPDCTFEEAIEMIDIGGPSLLRAAAKNHRSVVVVSDSAQMDIVRQRLREGAGTVDPETRIEMAAEAFGNTDICDDAIYDYLMKTAAERGNEPEPRIGSSGLRLPIRRLYSRCRYGENPHQHGSVYATYVTSPHKGPSIVGFHKGQSFGAARPMDSPLMSFNNYVDANAAMELCTELTRAVTGKALDHSRKPVVCFVKHTNACGVAIDKEPLEAYRKAYLGDPNAAMGGILAVNTDVHAAFAEAVMETYQRWGKEAGVGGFFVEGWIAAGFDDDAVELIRTKKAWGERVRLVGFGDPSEPPDAVEQDVKKIVGGMLVQDRDLVGLNEDRWKVVTERKPTEAEMNDLRLAWLICKHTKSNAITICRDGMLIGNGAGQMSRVMSCRIATWLAKENGHQEKLKGAVAASDAFFPFRDGPDILMDAGVRALIQPGGSKRDQEVIGACNERGVAMIFTGTRHFRH